MAMRQKMDIALRRSVILTLRLTKAEMLRFKLAALNLRTDRAKLVRDRVSDLIGIPRSGEGGGCEAAEAGREVAEGQSLDSQPGKEKTNREG